MRTGKTSVEDGTDGRAAAGEQPMLLRGDIGLRGIMDEPYPRALAEPVDQLVACGGKPGEVRLRGDDCHDRPFGLHGDPRANPGKTAAEQQREDRAKQKEEEC